MSNDIPKEVAIKIENDVYDRAHRILKNDSSIRDALSHTSDALTSLIDLKNHKKIYIQQNTQNGYIAWAYPRFENIPFAYGSISFYQPFF